MKIKKTSLAILIMCIVVCLGAFVFAGCGSFGEPQNTVCKHTGMEHISPKPATCTTDGNLEYWYCSDCKNYYSDSAYTVETTLAAVKVGKTGHQHITHEQAVSANCTTDGNLEYWYCSDCKNYYLDAEYKTATTQDDLKINIDANNHGYGEYVYDYGAMKYVRTCSYDKTHTDEMAAGTKEYPYLVNESTDLKTIVEEKGGYVKLQNNMVSPIINNKDARIDIKKDVVIDLGGYQYTNNVAYAFYVTKDTGVNAVIKNGTVIDNYSANSRAYAIFIAHSTSAEKAPGLKLDEVNITFGKAKSVRGVQVGDYATVTMTDCSIDGALYGVTVFKNSALTMTDCQITNGFVGVTGQGDAYSVEPVITLNNTDISVSDGAIYNPQMDGVTTINGGTIISEKAAAIEVRAGKVEINNATVIGNGEFKADATVNGGSGGTLFGVAVGISQHSTNKNIEVIIKGCTLKGVYALYEEDLLDDVACDRISITVTGNNTFTGGVYSENCANITAVAP